MNWKSKIVTAISILESDMKAADKVARALGFLEGPLKLDVEFWYCKFWFETDDNLNLVKEIFETAINSEYNKSNEKTNNF